MATIELTALDLALAALLLLLNAGVAVLLQLGLGRRILLAGVRAAAQLVLLGVVLRWVIELSAPWIVAALMVAMAVIAGIESVRRTRFRLQGLTTLSILVMLISSMSITLYTTQWILAVEPWYAPRYLIPILGMLLGNTLNGITLGLETTLSGFVDQTDRVELLLAHGATPREAARDVLRQAVRTGMIPILNSMTAAGLISIPGLMTGQILSGESPLQAALYQILILFCIAGGVALGTVGVVFGALRLVFDERQRLALHRLKRVS